MSLVGGPKPPEASIIPTVQPPLRFHLTAQQHGRLQLSAYPRRASIIFPSFNPRTSAPFLRHPPGQFRHLLSGLQLFPGPTAVERAATWLHPASGANSKRHQHQDPPEKNNKNDEKAKRSQPVTQSETYREQIRNTGRRPSSLEFIHPVLFPETSNRVPNINQQKQALKKGQQKSEQSIPSNQTTRLAGGRGTSLNGRIRLLESSASC